MPGRPRSISASTDGVMSTCSGSGFSSKSASQTLMRARSGCCSTITSRRRGAGRARVLVELVELFQRLDEGFSFEGAEALVLALDLRLALVDERLEAPQHGAVDDAGVGRFGHGDEVELPRGVASGSVVELRWRDRLDFSLTLFVPRQYRRRVHVKRRHPRVRLGGARRLGRGEMVH